MVDEYFSVIKGGTGTEARTGKLLTGHGTVLTPAFMPVASQGTVKTLIPEDLKNIDISIVLGNTYHLYLRPGIEVISRLGGLHQFMAWERPILTDSGGYQIFSLARLRKVSDEGVVFRSHIDGSEHHLSPESVIEYQEKLGADIIMTLDECPSIDAGMSAVREAVDRTTRWAERCRKRYRNQAQLLFGIIQGGISPQLRQESAKAITSLNFPGYAIGGLSLGEAKDLTWSMVAETMPLLPSNKPRYLMGVGTPEDLLDGVDAGIDMFDCVLPTRNARNGSLFTSEGKISIKNAKYIGDDRPVDSRCSCQTCRSVSRAYLRHLYVSGEIAAAVYNTIHNLWFYLDLMQGIRQSIASDSFAVFRATFLNRQQPITDSQ